MLSSGFDGVIRLILDGICAIRLRFLKDSCAHHLKQLDDLKHGCACLERAIAEAGWLLEWWHLNHANLRGGCRRGALPGADTVPSGCLDTILLTLLDQRDLGVASGRRCCAALARGVDRRW